jgi:hypothetical protein
MFTASGCESAGSERQMKRNVAVEINIFLIGMLSGVTMAAALTFACAIPANNYYWKTEIWRRGGAAWTFDMKTGHMGWNWIVEPKADAPRERPVARTGIQSKRSYRAAVDPEGFLPVGALVPAAILARDMRATTAVQVGVGSPEPPRRLGSIEPRGRRDRR